MSMICSSKNIPEPINCGCGLALLVKLLAIIFNRLGIESSSRLGWKRLRDWNGRG